MYGLMVISRLLGFIGFDRLLDECWEARRPGSQEAWRLGRLEEAFLPVQVVFFIGKELYVKDYRQNIIRPVLFVFSV